MKRWLDALLVLTLIFVLPYAAFCQTTHIDSLKRLVPGLPKDSTRVNLLNDISKKLYFENPEDAIKYAEKAKELSEEIGYKKGLGYSLKNIGLGYYALGNYPEVLVNWQQSLDVFQSIGDKPGEANMLSNIGAVYVDKGDAVHGLETLLKALKLAEEVKDTVRIATVLTNIATIYEFDGANYHQALKYQKRALELGVATQNYELIGTVASNMGQIYLTTNILDSALLFYEQSEVAFERADGLQNLPPTLASIGKLYAKKGDFNKAIAYLEEAIQLSSKLGNKQKTVTGLTFLGDTYKMSNHYQLAIDYYFKAEKLAVETGATPQLKDIYEGLFDAYEKKGDFKNAFKYHVALAETNDKLYTEKTSQKLDRLQFEFDLEKKESEIALLTKDKALKELELEKQTLTKNALLAGVAFLALLAFFLYTNYKQKDKTSKMLARQNSEIIMQKEEIESQRDDIEGQKKEIEGLMLNILPVEVAQELRKTGKATPRYYESVTVLFTDFKEFTRIAETLSAQHLVADLNECFIAFDKIIEEFGLEKIKTIGDAYMCACGIPSEVADHPQRTVRAALAIQKYIEDENTSRRERGAAIWELRIGIHTGPVIAGVVGKKKFAYDIWGNAVNLASRLETNGKEGKVNISESTYELVKDSFDCVYRGKIYAKNIGDVSMYFVEKEIQPAEVVDRVTV
jgi:adenylate cyclase